MLGELPYEINKMGSRQIRGLSSSSAAHIATAMPQQSYVAPARGGRHLKRYNVIAITLRYVFAFS